MTEHTAGLVEQLDAAQQHYLDLATRCGLAIEVLCAKERTADDPEESETDQQTVDRLAATHVVHLPAEGFVPPLVGSRTLADVLHHALVDDDEQPRAYRDVDAQDLQAALHLGYRSATELAEALDGSRVAVLRHLMSLGREGLVSVDRMGDPTGNRSWYLTDQGRSQEWLEDRASKLAQLWGHRRTK